MRTEATAVPAGQVVTATTAANVIAGVRLLLLPKLLLQLFAPCHIAAVAAAASTASFPRLLLLLGPSHAAAAPLRPIPPAGVFQLFSQVLEQLVTHVVVAKQAH